MHTCFSDVFIAQAFNFFKINITSAACRTWVNCHLFRAAQQKSRQLTQAATAGVMIEK
jgi:hypothetical protein